MILLIDNYDSFSYNLYQLIGAINPEIKVIRNDELTAEEIEALKPEAIILSPGPGRPQNAGCCIEVVQKARRENPDPRRVFGASGDLRGIRRSCFLCKTADARQTVRDKARYENAAVCWSAGGNDGGTVPFAGGAGGNLSGMPAGDCQDIGRRDHGTAA